MEADKHLAIGFQYCRVDDYVNVTRCYKCQEYGHTSAKCKSLTEVCSLCAKTGHDHRNCPNKNGPFTCINCKKVKKPAGHSAADPECLCYKYKLQATVNITGFSTAILHPKFFFIILFILFICSCH